MRGDLRRELGRKAFHLLTLLYLGAYRLLGVPAILWVLGAWTVLVGAVELARLKSPRINAFLLGLFGSIQREDEARRVSGIFWTSGGCWTTLALFGARPEVVSAALLYLAFGDAAAALAGKRFGRTAVTVLGRRKTLEGSLACLAVCAALGALGGLSGPGLWAGAAAATALELASLPPDDNFWLPVGSGLTLWLCA